MAGEYLTSPTPEHKKFVEFVLAIGVSFDPAAARL